MVTWSGKHQPIHGRPGLLQRADPVGVCQRLPLWTVLVDPNSTRTESCVAIRSDPKAQMQVDAQKIADHNGIPTDHQSEPGDAGGSENAMSCRAARLLARPNLGLARNRLPFPMSQEISMSIPGNGPRVLPYSVVPS